MKFSLSTHWNAHRHSSGKAMIEEIAAVGFDTVELGYNLTLDLVPGVLEAVDEKTVTVETVHNFCPLPVGAPSATPELFLPGSLDPAARKNAVRHIAKTVEFAGRVGAHTVVIHAGRVRMKNITPKLIALHSAGKQYSRKYEKLKVKLMMLRDRKAGRHLEALDKSIEELLPAIDSAGVRVALENLPSWEGLPAEDEIVDIVERFGPSRVGYWHDLGHAQVLQELGFINHLHCLERLKPYLAGIHLHDVVPPAFDHLMPPCGNMDFRAFKEACSSSKVIVFEPAPGTSSQEVRDGLACIGELWRE
ncbi:MAG: sugar phosphate isomerase/epimerase family protein [Kiritimatiellia bacterium]